MKGYKVFNCNWMTCNHFQWEVGKTYKHTGDLEMCASGFHFCKSLLDCFLYYGFDPINKVAEVEALGKIVEGDHKCITDNIKIVREIPWEEVLTIVNTGSGNTGWRNSGERNSGDRNTGKYNSGERNSGDYNAGDCNRGCYNTGDRNTGNCNAGNNNAGDYNSGDFNIGNYNSGSFNDCCHSTGFFNTEPSAIYMFNKPCDLTWNEINKLPGIKILQSVNLNKWIMFTNEEKAAHPNNAMTEGYVKGNRFKEAFEKFWQDLDEYDRQSIKDLPNFDPVIFKSITGIDV